MKTLLTLILDGDFESGFHATLEIRQGDIHSPSQSRTQGRLSGNGNILNRYRDWQQRYLSLEMLFRALSANSEQVTNSSQGKEAFTAFRDAADVFEATLNDWLNNCVEFRGIRDKLLRSPRKFQLLLQTNNSWLQRFPWERWDVLVEAEAEFALSAIEYDCPKNLNLFSTPKGTVKILAILGQGTDIDRDADKQILDKLAGKAGAEITWKEQPQTSELNEQLWQQGWDILFFAGHSGTSEEGKRGEIQLNDRERLTIADLRFALKKAIAQGLQLAIFNSCDGLGLAHQLATEPDLYLSRAIVMREKVPDRVSPKFLQYFLSAYIRGESLNGAVVETRQKLHGWEQDYPCASWLPVVCQNPTVRSPTWQELRYGRQDLSPRYFRRKAVLTSFMVTVLLMVVRHLGVLQPWELQMYDRFMRWRSDEGTDSRLLVVELTEEDFDYQDERGMKRKWSLGDTALEQLLANLEVHQPRAIGLDIYRDFPASPENRDLARRLAETDNLPSVRAVTRRAGR